MKQRPQQRATMATTTDKDVLPQCEGDRHGQNAPPTMTTMHNNDDEQRSRTTDIGDHDQTQPTDTLVATSLHPFSVFLPVNRVVATLFCKFN